VAFQALSSPIPLEFLSYDAAKVASPSIRFERVREHRRRPDFGLQKLGNIAIFWDWNWTLDTTSLTCGALVDSVTRSPRPQRLRSEGSIETSSWFLVGAERLDASSLSTSQRSLLADKISRF